MVLPHFLRTKPPDERLPYTGVFQPEVGEARNGGSGLLLGWGDDGQHGAVSEGAGKLQEISRRLQVSKGTKADDREGLIHV